MYDFRKVLCDDTKSENNDSRLTKYQTLKIKFKMEDNRYLEIVISSYLSEILSNLDEISNALEDGDYNETCFIKSQNFRIGFGGQTTDSLIVVRNLVLIRKFRPQ